MAEVYGKDTYTQEAADATREIQPLIDTALRTLLSNGFDVVGAKYLIDMAVFDAVLMERLPEWKPKPEPDVQETATSDPLTS